MRASRNHLDKLCLLTVKEIEQPTVLTKIVKDYIELLQGSQYSFIFIKTVMGLLNSAKKVKSKSSKVLLEHRTTNYYATLTKTQNAFNHEYIVVLTIRAKHKAGVSFKSKRGLKYVPSTKIAMSYRTAEDNTKRDITIFQKFVEEFHRQIAQEVRIQTGIPNTVKTEHIISILQDYCKL